MKLKIKSLIAYFIGNLNPMEKKISVQELSIFFSVLIATFTLRKNQSKTAKIKIPFADYHSEFKNEIHLVKQRFPELIKIFLSTESQIKIELLSSAFDKLKAAFEKTDDDVDDIISWSYQFLKKEFIKNLWQTIASIYFLSLQLLFLLEVDLRVQLILGVARIRKMTVDVSWLTLNP